MPKVSIDENGDSGTAEDEIWSPRKITNMLAESKPARVHCPTNRNLNSSVFASDTSHQLAAPLWGKVVRHPTYPASSDQRTAPVASGFSLN